MSIVLGLSKANISLALVSLIRSALFVLLNLFHTCRSLLLHSFSNKMLTRSSLNVLVKRSQVVSIANMKIDVTVINP